MMFDAHLNRQHRLQYTIRGPEWAFAVAQGDLSALEEVMRRCSTFWSGAGSLIIPVSVDGRIPRVIDAFLHARPVDRCFVHASVGERGRARLEAKLPGSARLWAGFDDHEVHPLNLVRGGEPGALLRDLSVPTFSSSRLRLATLALWGFIPDEDMPHWKETFRVKVTESADAHQALVDCQIRRRGESPLRLTMAHMHMTRATFTGANLPYVWVLPDSSFNSLLSFWNFRSRTVTPANGASVLGVMKEDAVKPERLAGLHSWLRREPGHVTTPDFLVACGGALREQVRQGLTAVPFNEDTSGRVGHETIISSGVGEQREPPSFTFCQPHIASVFVRGRAGNTLVAFADGSSSLVLPTPDSFTVRGGGQARVILDNLPLPLPLTDPMARRIHRHTSDNGGLMFLTTTRGPWSFDIQLPTAAEALLDWLGGHGFTLNVTGDSRDGDSILARLGSLDQLDALADRNRLAILDFLAPKTPKKLAQYVVRQAAAAGAKLNEANVVQQLKDGRLFLQTQAHTAHEIGAEIGARRPRVLELLNPLVNGGFVRRGHAIECPHCRFTVSLNLSELDEQIRCRACGQEFAFPTLIGSEEPPVAYRLDGLMANAMTRDMLPVLLALRAARKPFQNEPLFFAWPELTVTAPGDTRPFNIDLLVCACGDVWCYEVKRIASWLGRPQLDRLIKISEALGARPGIAALNGEFDTALTEQIAMRRGAVLSGAALTA